MIRFFKFIFKSFFYLSVFVFTWVLCLYLRSDVPPPRAVPTSIELEKAQSQAQWFDKKEFGIHHIFLKGTPFERGLAWGSLTSDKLLAQEKMLIEMYNELLPSEVVRKTFETLSMAVFEGLQETFEPWMLEEMWGVSQFASKEYDHLASSYARQLAYHGIHEIGQLFVDLAPLQGACTFVSFPQTNGKEKNWIVGRTFDFEGGRVFDEEKIVKWVSPAEGFKFVSVIWAGMVGAVSGVNEKGIYVSINAAGSKDVNLRGLPSTLLVTKVLQEAATLEDALKIFRDNDSMITDIYMVLDAKSQRLFKVEKSAMNLEMVEVKDATAVTNHLIADVFKDDEFNIIRRDEFTSKFRLERAQNLLMELSNKAATKKMSDSEVVNLLLKILRDKGVDTDGHILHLGNRRAIDALIAAHGVLYDSKADVLYVSEGPSMSGAFRGYSLKKSFELNKPIEITKLNRDPEVTPAQYQEVKRNLAALKGIFKDIRYGECQKAYDALGTFKFNHVEYEYAFAQAAQCLSKKEEAVIHAKRGLAFSPPHRSLEVYFKDILDPFEGAPRNEE